MGRLLFNEKKLNSRLKQSRETSFVTMIRLFGRIVRNNKILFLNCSLLAFLTAIINFAANLLFDKLIISPGDSTSLQSKEIILSFEVSVLSNQLRSFFGQFFGKSSKLKSYVFRLVIYLVFFKGAFSILHWYVTNYCSSKIAKDLKIELFEILTNSSYERSSEASSRMLTQFSSDINDIATNIWIIPNRLIYIFLSIFLNIFFNFNISFKEKKDSKHTLILVASLLFISLFFTVFLLLRKSTVLNVEARKRSEEDNRFIFERISNLGYIKSASSEKFEKAKLNDHLGSTLRRNQRFLFWSALFNSVPEYLVMPNIPLLFVLIVLYGFPNQVSTVGELFIYYRAVRRINSEVSKIFEVLISSEELSSSLSIVMDSIDFLVENEDSNGKELTTFTGGDVTFDNVTFAYPSRAQNNVIEDFSFTFEEGKRYGIAGKNGIGKSTITKLLLKLYKVSKGLILVNQDDLSTINTVEFHHSTCLLNNRPSFFNMSIAENIFYPFTYDRKKNLHKLIYAARKVRIFNFIKSLPASFDTVLRQGGIDLSEGQKQQLEAMKVFIRDYKIYIFDEILSNVHPLTRKVILKNIFTNIKNKLVIAIDHHYEIFSYMDYVYNFSSKKLTRVKYPEKLLE